MHGIDTAIQFGLRKRQCCRARIVDESLELTAAQCHAKKLHGQVRYLVRLVQDDRFGTRQKLDKSFLLHREVGQQQVMIHDDEVRFLCGLARLCHVATRVLPAFLAKAVVGRRRHERPDWRILRNLDQLRPVAALRAVTPGTHFVEIVLQSRCGLRNLVQALQT